MDEDFVGPIQSQLAHLMDFISEGFQALQLLLDGMDNRFHGHDEWMNALGRLVSMADAQHFET